MKTDFNSIHEGAEDEEIYLYIEAFMEEKDEMIKEKGIEYTMEQLAKIIDHNVINGYKPKHINEISDFIENHLDFNNDSFINIVLTIIITMHLESAWNKIVSAKDISNQRVIELIEDAKRENAEYKYFE